MNLPNQLSIFRILLTPIIVFLIFMDGTGFQLGAFIIFIIASLTDWWDGYTARRYGEITIIGQFLDPLADKILISSALICFSVLDYIPAWMVFVIVIRDFLMTGFRSYAILKGKPIKTSLVAKYKTFFQVVIVYIIFILHLLKHFKENQFFNSIFTFIHHYQMILIVLTFVTFLTMLSLIIYIIQNKKLVAAIWRDFFRIFATS